MDPNEDEEARYLRKKKLKKLGAQQNMELTGVPTPTGQAAGGGYNYQDPGRFGAEGYSYNPGDEFHHPGPEPPRDSPEWPAWKQHAKAWRNYIGGRQRYVDDLISVGYSPEDLGILPQKEQGLAGWNRLNRSAGEAMGWEYDWGRGVKRDIATSDETARDRWLPIEADERARHAQGGTRQNELQRNQESWIRDVAAGPSGSLQIDPVSGMYYNDSPGGGRTYYDRLGGVVNAQGQRIGGAYGMEAGQRFATNRHSSPNGAGSVTGWGTTVGVNPVNNRQFGGPQRATAPVASQAESYYEYRPYLREDTGSQWGGWGNPYGKVRDRAQTKGYQAMTGQRIVPR